MTDFFVSGGFTTFVASLITLLLWLSKILR